MRSAVRAELDPDWLKISIPSPTGLSLRAGPESLGLNFIMTWRRQVPGISWTRARAALHGSANAPPLWARACDKRRAIERCWRLIAAALLEVPHLMGCSICKALSPKTPLGRMAVRSDRQTPAFCSTSRNVHSNARWGRNTRMVTQDSLASDELGPPGGQAVAELHCANMAHLDLRPEHVFVAREAGSGAFTVTLLDFSSARELGSAGAFLGARP